MREILFRGKRNRDGVWVCGGLISVNDDEHGKAAIIAPPNAEAYRFNISGDYVRPETVGQYTGLTDKYGTKIFEGDIVKYTDDAGYYPEEQCEFVGKIVFENGAFGIATNDTIPIDLDFWCDNDNFVSLWELYWNLCAEGETLYMIEIIGNIHDNPELLGGAGN